MTIEAHSEVGVSAVFRGPYGEVPADNSALEVTAKATGLPYSLTLIASNAGGRAQGVRAIRDAGIEGTTR